MPLIRVRDPFDHPDWLFELKHDGFRALAIVDRHHCRLVSRRGRVFKRWPQLERELAHTVQAKSAVLDGEVVCLRPDGSSDFNALMFRRDWPYFIAFDLLILDGRDLRGEPLRARKHILRRLVPRGPHEALRYLETMFAGAAGPVRCSVRARHHLQYVAIVVKFLRDHPERLHEIRQRLIQEALSAAFPCKGKQPEGRRPRVQ